MDKDTLTLHYKQENIKKYLIVMNILLSSIFYDKQRTRDLIELSDPFYYFRNNNNNDKNFLLFPLINSEACSNLFFL